MKVETKFTIGGNVVEECFKCNDLTVYSYEIDMTCHILYFVKNGNVLFKQTIQADCGQNTGYIDSIDFETVK